MLAASNATAQAGDPSQDWKTLESANFIVHYDAHLHEVAVRIAALAERSHAVLAPAMSGPPTERTHVLVLDVTDSSNGFARTIPRNQMTIFVTAPEGFSQLSDFDDWLFGLVAHEYAHVLHLDEVGGLAKWVNRVVGKTWSPNQVQPRWMIEGLATYQEGKRTSGGRTRLSEFAADIRLASLAGTSLGLDQVSSGSRFWPHGTAAYQVGSSFLKYVFDRYGDDSVGRLSVNYGANPIPWSLNRTFKDATGKPLTTLYDEWRDHIDSTSALTVEAVERAGRREGERYTFTGEGNFFPRFHPSKPDAVVWLRADGRSDANLMESPASAPGGGAKTLFTTGRIRTFDVASDSSVVATMGFSYYGTYAFRDLVWIDSKTRRVTKLTEKVRASEPALSPDEKKVAYVVNDAGRRHLAVLTRSDGLVRKPTILWTGPDRYDQAYQPAWSPDGKTIAFSAWRQGGFRDIVTVEVESGRATILSKTRAQDVTPAFGPDGRFLYFSSDRTGVANIYAIDLNGPPGTRLYQVTNVVGGAVHPDVSPDGKRMVFQGNVVGGVDLFTIELDPKTFTVANAFINDRPEAILVRTSDVRVTEPRDYRPIETMAPQAYQLQLVLDSFGQGVSLTTNGADIINRHVYSLGVTMGLEDRNLNVAARYTYNRLWPRLSVSLRRSAGRRGGFIIDGENNRYTEEAIVGSVSATLPAFVTPRFSGSVTFEYGGTLLRNLEDPFVDYDPNEKVPIFPETDAVVAGFGVRWSLFGVRRFLNGIGPSVGTSFSVSARLDHPAFGSDFKTLALDYGFSKHGTLPLLELTTLSLNLRGGVRFSDRRRQGGFAFGGVPEQEILDSVINTIRFSPTGYLRGFERDRVAGRTYHLANIELRTELRRIERGLASLPIYISRLHLAGLLDVGNTWAEKVDPLDMRLGVGGALRLDVVFGYFAPGSFDIGYARGFGRDGTNEFWFLLTTII